ncbi:hypothetical protein IHE45_07G093400 [Dioscorea alata]|uniref:Uncharacterized protein n=6 Tax=Dioscorea alata TaxID=55571 RepID=A0ACB7VSG7_DIOAL|nr:hypothetical protein IHE45_07G093400 [Dioscorea alata]KAH7677574.1 hypothetical protein IHE45_07G093400 [Dioscorea alata]KAH7677575.1 hypothetical protein IHE45_07G093400 [Dioscorea alata]KAH7677576.1 hypothetical protein IHE45_07G093400 [Dioscorea alata]KAH7677577.1 hypothetical protein IHE45_07G093400 [Dioscorea alata]
MGVNMVFVLVVVFVVAQVSSVFPASITAPAFLWGSDDYGLSLNGVKEGITYQTISPHYLAKSVLFEGGWSNIVCSTENHHPKVDIALVFVGRKLQSSDLSKTKYQDQALLDVLKLSLTHSNFSMAFPYVAFLEEKGKLDNSLFSEFIENCGHKLEVNHVAYLESCSLHGENLKKLQDLQSFQDFVGTRMENGGNEKKTDLVFFCNVDSGHLDHVKSEGEILRELVNFLDQSGASYSMLYVSDPYTSLQYLPNLSRSRILAENTSGNSTTCDGVCQIKSSLLEGFFVGIVLLIILISGLCCMMGIDTPTRFETPQES